MNDLVDQDDKVFCAEPGPRGTVLYWYEKLVEDMGFDPATPAPEVGDLEPWPRDVDFHDLILALAREKAAGGTDVAQLLYQEQCLAWFLKRQQEARDDPAGSEEDGPEPAAAGLGGGGAVSGEPEDSGGLGEGEADPSAAATGGPVSVPRRTGKRKTRR